MSMRQCLVNAMRRYGIVSDDDADIYMYGLECFYMKCVGIATFICIALILNMIAEMMTILVAFVNIRKCAGGFHAKTKFRCLFFSAFIMCAALLLCRTELSAMLYGVSLLCSDVGLMMLSPVDTANNRLNAREKVYFRHEMVAKLFLINVITVTCMYCGSFKVYIPMVIGVMLSFFMVLLGYMVEKKTSDLEML